MMQMVIGTQRTGSLKMMVHARLPGCMLICIDAKGTMETPDIGIGGPDGLQLKALSNQSGKKSSVLSCAQAGWASNRRKLFSAATTVLSACTAMPSRNAAKRAAGCRGACVKRPAKSTALGTSASTNLGIHRGNTFTEQF
jgi:hypothetical protein